MGKWGHRPPRRFFRQEKLPSSTPLPFHPKPPSPSPSEFRRDGIPQWEKEYCTLIGSIPWWKVVEGKKYMYGNSDVLNWDDSAGEEAFQNAKKRFWADINGLHCDISLPASDIYIDEIDWNPFIDPELIKEVEREYFAPDDGKGNEILEQKRRKMEHSAIIPPDRLHCLSDTSTNPWESHNIEFSGGSQIEAQGWNQEDNHIDLVDGEDNPWERGITQTKEKIEKTAWEDKRDNSWTRSQKGKDVILSKDWNDCGDPWERDCEGVTDVKGNNRWGAPSCKSWSSNQVETKNFDHGENPWGGSSRNNRALLKDRGWKDCGHDELCRKQRHCHSKQRNFLDYRTNGGCRDRNNDGSNRQRSHQYISGHQNSRFQGSDCQTGRIWRRKDNGRVG